MKKLIFIIPAIILLGCSVQKRKYQKGFYVSWKHNSQKEHILNAPEKDHAVLAAKPVRVTEVLPAEPVTAIVENKSPAAIISVRKPVSLFSKDGPCDNLVFKDGTEQMAKIIEITPTEVKYKKCDLPDGPLYVIRKSELFMIKYANGTREVFKNDPTGPQRPYTGGSSVPNSQKETLPMAIVALVLGILALFFGIFTAIPAIIVGNNALKKIRANPDRYKGEGLAMAGKIIGIVTLVLTLLVLIIILALI